MAFLPKHQLQFISISRNALWRQAKRFESSVQAFLCYLPLEYEEILYPSGK